MVLLTGRSSLVKYCEQHNIAIEDFNDDVEVVEGCSDITGLLEGCESFNSNITLPSTVHILKRMLRNCPNYDRHIMLPAEALDCSQMFEGCYGFNKPVRLPPTLRNTFKMFYDCVSLEQPIELPDGIMIYEGMLTNTVSTPIFKNDTYSSDRLFKELEDDEDDDLFDDVYQLEDIPDQCAPKIEELRPPKQKSSLWWHKPKTKNVKVNHNTQSK